MDQHVEFAHHQCYKLDCSTTRPHQTPRLNNSDKDKDTSINMSQPQLSFLFRNILLFLPTAAKQCPFHNKSGGSCVYAGHAYIKRSNNHSICSTLIIIFLSWAGMSKPNQQPVFSENLYEIPSCTICLQELAQGICCLDCGHVFHPICIEQHFEYKSTCPNCQKRTHRNQIRPIVFQLTLNSRANSQLHSILEALDGSERKQVEHLLMEVKIATQTVQKMKVQFMESEREVQAEKKVVQGLRDDLKKKKGEIQLLRKQNVELNKDWKGLSQDVLEKNKSLVYLQSEVDKLRKEQEGYKDYKKMKKLMNQNSAEMSKYRDDLQQAKTTPENMAGIFFDLVNMKHLQMLGYKEKEENLKAQVSQLKSELYRNKNKNDIQKMQKQLNDANFKYNIVRQKYDKLKGKYRCLIEKSKKGGIRQNDIPDMEDSQQGFIPITAPSKPILLPLEQHIAQSTMVRPTFNSTTTYGGLGRKNPLKREDLSRFKL